MKRKLLMLTALALCLALLCGCTTIATSEWMQNLFPVGDEAVAAQQTGSVNGSEDKQEVKQVVTETYTAWPTSRITACSPITARVSTTASSFPSSTSRCSP